MYHKLLNAHQPMLKNFAGCGEQVPVTDRMGAMVGLPPGSTSACRSVRKPTTPTRIVQPPPYTYQLPLKCHCPHRGCRTFSWPLNVFSQRLPVPNRTAERSQTVISYITNCAAGRHNMSPPPASWPLTLKVVS